MAQKYGVLPCDGIGLMREEFIWTTFIHEHPLHLIETGRSDFAVNTLAEGMRKVCQALAPRQVVVRLSDFKSSEYRDLKGGDKYEHMNLVHYLAGVAHLATMILSTHLLSN